MQTAAPCFDLPPRYSPAEDDDLLEFLRLHDRTAVRIDAGALRSVDGLLLELLLIAARRWRAAGQEFEVAGISGHIEEELALLGVSVDTLSGGRSQ